MGLVPTALFSPVLLGGDQLTAARARGAKKAKVSADICVVSWTERRERLFEVRTRCTPEAIMGFHH